MASASASVNRRAVSLSHCSDTYGFVDNLCSALGDAGVIVFRSCEGRHYNPSLGRSNIFVIIFSKGYAYIDDNELVPPWPLSQLTRKGNKMLLPVFYEVSRPEALEQARTNAGTYRDRIFQYGCHPYKLKEIDDALKELEKMKGIEFKDTDRQEAQKTRLVVSRVLRELGGGPYHELNSLVGIDDRVEAVMGLLDLDANDVRMIGIYGMGGVGKSTLAKVIFNRILGRFGGCCFLKDVRDVVSQPDGLQHLKNQLATEFSRHEPYDSARHRHLRKHSLQNKKVLIVLDDVDDARQIFELAGSHHKFGLGSRVIVTTRNRKVLPKDGQTYEYEVKELDQHDAFLLFCKQAFQQDSPPEKRVALCHKIIKATGGLPLAVETIGSYLFSATDEVWEEALGRLETEPGVQDKLKISYNILDDKQKQMFLDVACFFRGLDVRIPAHMWRDCDYFSQAGIELLDLMSLIKIGDDNKLWIHDQLRDLGREIIRQENTKIPGKRSRLWGKEALELLQNNKGARKWFFRFIGVGRKVNAIRLDYEAGSKESVLSGDNFAGLKNLRYLDLANANVKGNFHRPLPNLRWLAWHGHSELNILENLHLKKLLILDLSKSSISEKWKGWCAIKEAKNLEVLDLTGCHHLARTPDLSSFLYMKRLILRDCSLLDTVDPSIGHLENLIFLDIRNCPSLKRVPEELSYLVKLTELLIDETSIEELPDFVWVKNLETLSAKSCRSLRQIPKSIKTMTKLQKILLDNCEALTEIPHAIGQLESLKELSLSHTRVMELPDSIENWSDLEVLNIGHCPIKNFPSPLRNLQKLRVINASGCVNLTGDIPMELGQLISLKILRLDHTNISSIPTCIEGLPHLQMLDLEGCMNLRTLPRLPVSLIDLKVTLASSMTVTNLHELLNLKYLEFQRHNSSFIPKHSDKDASSSSSSNLIQPGYEFEVFLSFRGPDTRETFTDILHKRLTEAGIRTFIDNEALHFGEKIGPDLLGAIDQSKISIPIFSKGYASSKWCLMEAKKIAKLVDAGKQKVFPIFFGVAPDEVRHQTGGFGESFSELVKFKKYDPKIIQEWRDALNNIGSRKGWDLNSSANSHQGTVLQEMVSKILKRLKKPYLDVTENLVGMENHMEGVMRLLDADVTDTSMLGIWGMGGVGKTTLAKFIFNRLASQFEYHSFLENIRGASRELKILESLQTKLAHDTSRIKYEKFADVDEGKSVLQSCLRNKKVLIFVDDVDHSEQLDCLLGGIDWLGPGSKIIVTTREADVLYKSKMQWMCYEVKEMNPHNAFLLFCKHAFRQDSPLPEFARLSWDIVEATGGLPLAIRAIGSSLSFTKEKEVWEEAIYSMKTKKEIHDKLKVSYDALNSEQQEIFLDIACLFKGVDKRIAVHMWKARKFSPESTLQDLYLRSLIKVGDDNTLWMHDRFVDVGREIVRRESQYKLGEQSRLWCGKDVIDVLDNGKGTKEVKAIHLDRGNESEKCLFSQESFKMLSNLELLALGDAKLCGNFEGCLLSLRWLTWHGHNLVNTPHGLHLKNLVIADLSKSEIRDDWNGWNSVKEAVTLEVLNLSGCHQLTRTPDFSTFLRMKRLILEDCQRLVEVGPTIGHLKTLEFLDLRNCLSLEKLPEEFGHLAAIIELLLDGSGIQELPISAGMKKLKIISARFCGSLTNIPSTIGKLGSLKELNLSRTGVVYLPDSIENLSNLEVLNMDHCLIGNFPQSLWKLRELRLINASGCRNLKGEIPSELGSLNFLSVLRLDQTGVTTIPESIRELPLLHTLDLKDCMKLQSLPNLPTSLVNLKVTLRSSMVIPNLPALVNLKNLEILHGGDLAEVLKHIESFSKIEKLIITTRRTTEQG